MAALHDCGLGRKLAELLDDGDIDAAIEAGLMEFVCCTNCDGGGTTPCTGTACRAPTEIIRDAQERLRVAWAARERFRARERRLARRAAERDAARNIAAKQPAALPPAAAAALARAKAKAAGRSPR